MERRAMGRIEIVPRTGPFEGQTVGTDREGYGVFTREPNGSLLQHLGTSQTPRFRNAKQFSAWLRRNYY